MIIIIRGGNWLSICLSVLLLTVNYSPYNTDYRKLPWIILAYDTALLHTGHRPTNPTKKGPIMSEATPETTAPETPQIPSRDSLPLFVQSVLTAMEPEWETYKSLSAERDRAAKVPQLLFEAIEKSEDAEVVKARKRKEQLQKQLDDVDTALENLVRPTLDVPTEERAKEIDTILKGKDVDIAGYSLVFTTEIGKNEDYKDYDLTLESYLGALPKRTKASASTGTGPGRPRVIVRVAKGNNPDKVKDEDFVYPGGSADNASFTDLAMYFKKEIDGYDPTASELSNEWLAQVHKDKWQDADESSFFILKDHVVTVQKKQQ